MIRLILVLILLIPAPALAQKPADPMRGLIWGLPSAQIRDFEKAKFMGEEEGLIYYSSPIRIDDKRKFSALIEYHFTDDKLDRIRYDFNVPQTNPSETMNDAMAMQAWVDEALGQAGTPEFDFRHSYTRNNPDRWGWAIYKGDATMNVNWRTDDTAAKLALSGEDYKADVRLTLSETRKAPGTP